MIDKYKQVKLTKDIIDKFKSKYSMLKHTSEYSDKDKAYAWFDNKNLVGYVCVTNGHIKVLEVTPDYQNKGIGTEIFKFAVKKLGGKILGVYKDNKTAIDIYKKNGFKITQSQGDSRYIMVKESSGLDMYNFNLIQNWRINND